MRIEFEKIRFKNILSYGDVFSEYNFKNGIDLIGESNGAGKSTVIESVFYALFGKPFRKIKNGSLINDITNKNLLTEIYFRIDKVSYKVKRGQKKNIFIIYKLDDDEYIEIPEKATTREYQIYFEEEILKIDETVFRQLISISSNSTSSKPFMELTQKEKESLFQVITDTSIFNHLVDKIKTKSQDAKIELKELDYKNGIISSSVQSEKIMIDQAKKQNDDFIKHHQDNIDKTIEYINLSKDNIKKYSTAIEKLKELKDKYNIEVQNLTDLQQEETVINYEIQEYNEDKIDTIIREYDESIIALDDTYYSLKYNDEILQEETQEEIITISTRIRELKIIIKQIEAAKKGSINCSNCGTVNYITEVDKEEIKNHFNIIHELQDLEDKLDHKKEYVETLKAQILELKNQDKKHFDNSKIQLRETKDKALKNIKERSNDYKKEERETLQNSINSKRILIDSYKEKLLKSKHIKNTLQEHESNLTFYENKLLELQSIKLVQIDESSLVQKQKELDETKVKISDKSKIIKDLNYLFNMVSDKGDNNLKGQVIARTVPFLNKGINYFLELFSLNNFNFVIDENFKEQIISRDSNLEFNGLSNGQKMRISFSIMFSFLKLIEERNGVSTNLLILDEVMDGSLDPMGREELLQIIKNEFSDTKNVIIISHNDQIKEKTELFNRIVHIKKNKFSTLRIEEL